MMTTALRGRLPATRARSSSGALVRCLAAVLALSVLVVLIVALAAESGPATSVAVGAAIGLGVMSFGTLTMDTVARVMPAVSVSLALMTYCFQIAVTMAVLVALSRSGALDDGLDRRWLGLALIAVVIVWSIGHVVAVATARLPVYDLPDRAGDGGAR